MPPKDLVDRLNDFEAAQAALREERPSSLDQFDDLDESIFEATYQHPVE